MKISKWIIGILLSLVVFSGLRAEEFIGEVVAVTDGDTIGVMRDGKMVKVRLYGIDAPEKKQPYGTAAKKALMGLLGDAPVKVEVVSRDRYGRLVGKVWSGPTGNVNENMLHYGMAWAYRQYLKGDDLFRYMRIEGDAMTSNIGLWADTNRVPPWEWRRAKKKRSKT